jgi:hypothetical protein
MTRYAAFSLIRNLSWTQKLAFTVEIAVKLSSGLGRNLVYVKLSGEQSIQQFLKMGMLKHYAKVFVP